MIAGWVIIIDLCFVVIEPSQMIKINKFKKQTDRLLVVSEKKLYKVDAAKIKVIQEDDHVHDDCGDAGYERGGSRASDWTILRHRRQPNGE